MTLPQYFEDIPKEVRDGMPDELREYLTEHLDGPQPTYEYTTAVRRTELALGDKSTARLFNSYFFEDCLQRLEEIKRVYCDSDYHPASDRKYFLANITSVTDKRALPMGDAERLLSELRGFNRHYREIRARHAFKIQSADMTAEDFETNGMSRQAATKGQLEDYRKAFLSTYYPLRKLLTIMQEQQEVRSLRL